jgi:hypothetical protein
MRQGGINLIIMDFKDTVLQLADRIQKQKDAIATEEATKNAFIMPMISALGYDIFNPFEVVPELDCDINKKKGEKIDYAIMKDNEPILLIECKHCLQNLDLHDTQLQRYFVASKARFGVLTNGIEYRFYTDLEKANIMDEKPFLVINLLNVSDAEIEQLKKFHKSYYNEEEVLSTANELKYTTEIKNILSSEFLSPSADFVRFFARQTYSGQVTAKVIDMFTPLVKKSISSVINEIISNRLNTAIKNEGDGEQQQQQEQTQQQSEETEKLPDGVVFMDKEKGIVTTQEEIDGYNIVRSILREKIDASRIQYKDYQRYFAINLDGSKWKWICRIQIQQRKKWICFPLNDYKENEWVEIGSIDDIFKFSERLYESLEIAQKL